MRLLEIIDEIIITRHRIDGLEWERKLWGGEEKKIIEVWIKKMEKRMKELLDKLKLYSKSDNYKKVLVEDVKKKYKIEEFIGQYVELKKVGKILRGLCCFHKEKHPSLTVYPDKQSFKCWGCSAGGNIIDFVMKLFEVDFRESLRLLDVGQLPLPKEQSEGLKRTNR